MRKQRLEQELKLLHKENNNLQEQFEQLSQKLLAQSRETSSERLHLQQELQMLKTEVEFARARKSEKEQRVEELEKNITTANQELLEAREKMAEIEENSQKEIISLQKLVALYKEAVAETQEKVKSHSNTVSSLRELLRSTQAETESVRQERTQELKDLRNAVEELEKERSQLKFELANANDLISKSTISNSDPVSFLSPSAAMAGSILKEGMTLTEMWTELINTRKSLFAEQQEVSRLEEFLQQILTDVEAKAPLFQRQKAELVQAEMAKQQLTASLEESHREYEHVEDLWRKEQSRASRLHSINQRLELTVTELSSQIQQLLHRVTELGGGVVENEPVPGIGVLNQSMDTINQDVVAIDSIRTLQEQNVKLMLKVRELTDQIDQKAEVAREAADAELQQQLQEALNQLRELQKSRKQHETTVDVLSRQRDMFKALYTEACLAMGKDPENTTRLVMSPGQQQTGISHSYIVESTDLSSHQHSTPQHQADNLDGKKTSIEFTDNGRLLRELQADFESYRKQQQETGNLLNEQLEKAREDASQARLENARLNASNEHLATRYRDLESSVDNLRRENRRLLDQASESANLLVQTQTRLQTAEDRYSEVNTSLQSLKVFFIFFGT